MPSQVLSSVENNFTKGLVTEFTGLNFPENAATDTDNCVYSIVGDVVRRDGFDYETNFTLNTIDRTNKAISDYKWNNASGDGSTQIVVTQVGANLYFYKSSSATIAGPLSANILGSIISMTTFVASGGTLDTTLECQFADGNGYLFVYHPSCDPFYCTYASGVITAAVINLKVRDFAGIPEAISDTTRPLAPLLSTHLYNLQNQGWGANWGSSVTNSLTIAVGTQTLTVADNTIPVNVGDSVNIVFTGVNNYMTGAVVSYTGFTMVVNVTSIIGTGTGTGFFVYPTARFAQIWFAQMGNYPSNSDVWWTFKDSSNNFNPATTSIQVTTSNSAAPKGSHILNVFNQDRYQFISKAVGPTIANTTTTVRPRTGTWYQGRVWYVGVDSSVPAFGSTYSWTENIYFSQIVQTPSDFGKCYQHNDPTDPDLFGLLPTDGGVIQIQGCGSVYKLFPLQNALLVFAANGVWYITGSQGIGFTANDYTIVKLSSVRSISTTSFIDVQGLPMFWNEEGIYSVEPAKQGTSLLNSPLHVNPLEVTPITVGTILTFYNAIPLQSKKFARGDYNPIDYIVQWTYKSVDETGITSRYEFDSILNYNNYNKAFYPYSLPQGNVPHIHSIRYVVGPGGASSPLPVFKYLTSISAGASYSFTFSEESSSSFKDWVTTTGGTDYTSFFVTGYKLHGQGQRRFQIPYIYMFSRGSPVAYKIQGLWDYATSGDSGRWSVAQLANIWSPNFGVTSRRHRIRGRGLVLQLKVQSVEGMPFDIIGWSTFETQNTSV